MVKLEFVECSQCAAKAEYVELCESCLHNRHVIYELTKQAQRVVQKETQRSTNYIIYEWSEVKQALNNCIRKYNPLFFKKEPDMDYVKDIYKDHLTSMIKDLFVQYFTLDTNRNDPDIQILIDAQKQLNDVGYLGRKEVPLLFTHKSNI